MKYWPAQNLIHIDQLKNHLDQHPLVSSEWLDPVRYLALVLPCRSGACASIPSSLQARSACVKKTPGVRDTSPVWWDAWFWVPWLYLQPNICEGKTHPEDFSARPHLSFSHCSSHCCLIDEHEENYLIFEVCSNDWLVCFHDIPLEACTGKWKFCSFASLNHSQNLHYFEQSMSCRHTPCPSAVSAAIAHHDYWNYDYVCVLFLVFAEIWRWRDCSKTCPPKSIILWPLMFQNMAKSLCKFGRSANERLCLLQASFIL